MIGKVLWTGARNFIGMDWNDDENLILVFENCDIDVYNIRCNKIVEIKHMMGYEIISGDLEFLSF